MTEVFKAATLEEAKENAAKRFGGNIKFVKFEVLEEGKRGVFGFGKREAILKAVYDPEVMAAASASKVQTKPAAKKTEVFVNKEVPKTVAHEPKIEEAPVSKAVNDEPLKKESVPAAVVSAVKNVPEKKPERAVSSIDEDFFSLDSFTLIEDEDLIHPKVKLAKDYISSILGAMGIEVTYAVYQNETGAVVNIESSNNGTVIGRRGETLDAIQYLCSIIANKGDKDYYRITIDCLGYRSKRRDTLEQLAAKVAKSVLRTGRSQPLEPMNPYERRVIHSAISKIDGVSSRSVGEEPYRKIIVSSNNPRYNNKRRDGGHRDNGRNDRRNDRRNSDKEVTMERKSVNLATSFEKDYKRPKPEDSIEGGLYGKIEF